MNRRELGWIVPCLAAALWLAGMAGRAPVDHARADDDFVDPAPEPPTSQQVHWVTLDQQIDMMDRSQRHVDDGSGIPTPVEMHVASIASACGLSASQRELLATLPALHDTLYAAAVRRLRAIYRGRSISLEDPAGQREWSRFHDDWRQVESIRDAMTVGEGRLARLVDGILDDAQRSRWQHEVRARQAESLQESLAEGLEQFARRAGLTARQFDAVSALLELDRPRLNLSRLERSLGLTTPYIFAFEFSRVDRERLDALLDEPQRAEVTKLLTETAGIIKFIETNAVIRDEEGK